MNAKVAISGRRLVKSIIGIVFFVSIIALGCTHGEKITRVQPGMPIEEVQSIMGPQEGYREVGEYQIYSYYNKVISGWNTLNRADYHYVVKNGKVVAYGAGEIRQDQSTGVVFIVPIGR